ncbi:hypothetical protein [uncultured Cohaesibacter sp.]|uniref:hypothetical protein n=1 Tax=uncultured Cohaesibacter sp. TaxID=1002546 RepID=UPI0029C763D3|nr:hypothetical protein [uncultured Cohaesibacter sp.]
MSGLSTSFGESGQGSTDETALGTFEHLIIFLLCLILTVLPLVLHFVSPLLAVAAQFVVASGVVIFFTPYAPLVVVFSLLFQNFFISIFSGYLLTKEDYNFVRGYNFYTTAVFWLWLFGQYALCWRDCGRLVNRIMLVCLIGFALIGFYFLLGMAKSPAGAIVYLRNIITPLLVFQIFFLATLKRPIPLLPFFTILTVVVIILGYIEMSDRRLWLDLTNGWTLWEFSNRQAMLNLAADKSAQETGKFVTDILDLMKIQFLNTPLLGDFRLIILRMSGPNGHAISYAYVLMFLAILMLTNKRWYLAVLMIPLLLMASAKGALIMGLLSFCALIARKFFGAVFAIWSLAAVLVIYIILGVVTGLKIGDFHVLGFMGGVYNFIDYPFGNGIGDAGNMSTNFSELDWSAYQHAGRTPVAMESAVGVLLHQMGFAAFGLLAVYFWIALQTYRVSFISRVNLHSVACFISMIALVNGVFQEEAIFSPLSLGLIMGLNGYILGKFAKFGREI